MPMIAKSKPHREGPDDKVDLDQAPEWGPDEWAQARPAMEVMGEILGQSAAAELLARSDAHASPRRRGGRPKAAVTKTKINIRLSPDVLDYYRATGPGWQVRMEKVLREGMK